MKTLLLTVLTLSSAFAFAKGGGSKPMTADRFMHESVEHSLFLAKQAGAGMIKATSTQVINAETINVTFTNSNGEIYNFQCILVDDISKGGTVVKKDVRCGAI